MAIPLHAKRRINAGPLNPPVDYAPGPEMLPVSHYRRGHRLDERSRANRGRQLRRPPPSRQPPLPSVRLYSSHRDTGTSSGKCSHRGSLRNSRSERSIRPWRSWTSRRPRLEACGCAIDESPDETRSRLERTGECKNSFHSSIVSNHWHSQAVTAYDPGCLQQHLVVEDQEGLLRLPVRGGGLEDQGERARQFEIEAASQRQDPAPGCYRFLCQRGFQKQGTDRSHGLVLRQRGTSLPRSVKPRTPDQFTAWIHFETTGHRAPVA